MAVIRWDPGRDLDVFQRDVNRLFDGFFQGRSGDSGGHRRWVPAMDLVESGDEFVLRVDLPGLSQEDVEVEITDNVLSVSGERRAEHEAKGEGYHRVERSFGHFSRSVTLPEGTEENAVKASFENGVLEVRVPKPAEKQPVRVQIGKGAVEGSGTESSAAAAEE